MVKVAKIEDKRQRQKGHKSTVKRPNVEPMPRVGLGNPAAEESDSAHIPVEDEDKVRKEKAVKHDDAKAPTHAWLRFLLLRPFGLVGKLLDQTTTQGRKLVKVHWPTLNGNEEERDATSRQLVITWG